MTVRKRDFPGSNFLHWLNNAQIDGDLAVGGTITGAFAGTSLTSGAAAADTVAQADGAGAVTFAARIKSLCKSGSTALTGAVTLSGGRDVTLTQSAQNISVAANVLTVRVGADVPTGAQVAGELPLAYDTTAVTGGFYFWNGAAWVKVATIL